MKKSIYLLMSLILLLLSLPFIYIILDNIINSQNYNSVFTNILKCSIAGGICVFGTIIFGMKFYKILKVDNKEKQNKIKSLYEKDKIYKEQNKEEILYDKQLRIAGTSFHQKELIEVATNGMKYDYIEPYDGLSTKEIKIEGDKVWQIADSRFKSIHLEPYQYKGDDAIKFYVNNYLNEFIEVGNIPKEEVQELLPLLNDNYNISADAYFVGGKYKEYDLYEEKMKTEELNIGIRLNIRIKRK